MNSSSSQGGDDDSVKISAASGCYSGALSKTSQIVRVPAQQVIPVPNQSHSSSSKAAVCSSRPSGNNNSIAHANEASGFNRNYVQQVNFNNSFRGGPQFGAPRFNSAQLPFVSYPYSSPLPLYEAPIFVPHAPMPRLRPATHTLFRSPLPADNWSWPRGYGLPPAVYPPPPLPFRIQRQIEFYFSNENLVKDVYLRKHMDAQGWVPIELVANFPMVQNLAKNTKFQNINNISEVMRSSVLVEVKDDKIRKRNEWDKWIFGYPLLAPAQPIIEEKSITSSNTPAQPDNVEETVTSSDASAQPASEDQKMTS